MRKVLADRNIATILASTLLLGIAYGISISLTSLHLKASHFSKVDLGLLATCFATGILIFSVPAGKLVRVVSPKWALVIALTGYAVVVALFPHLTTFTGVAIARFFDGAFSAGIWVGSETALLARAEPRRKAFVMSIYAVTVAIGYLVGPGVARLLSGFPAARSFELSGLLALAAAGVCALRLEPGLVHEEAPSPSGKILPAPDGPLGALLARIRCSCFATFSYGYFQSSTVIFLPVFLVETKGITSAQAILVPAFFAGGMLAFSNVVGRIGDEVGHLRTMRVLAVMGFFTILAFVFLDSFWAMGAAITLAGATLATISPLSLALQGVVLEPHELSRANGIYNGFYAMGMLIGPAVSSVLFERYGGPVMLFHVAALWAGFVALSIVFRMDDPRARGETTRRVVVDVEGSSADAVAPVAAAERS